MTMRRVLTVLVVALCFGCSAGESLPTERGKPAGTATSIEASDRWIASDDHVTHVTTVTDKAGTGREFACFFGEWRGYSRAMSCVQVKP